MALIRCNECGKTISDKAFSCPNCGCPQEKFKTRKTTIMFASQKCNIKVLKGVFIAIVLLLLFVLVAYWIWSPKKYTLDHQCIDGTLLRQMFGVSNKCERDFDLIRYDDKSLNIYKAIGYFSGNDSLMYHSQFDRGSTVHLLDSEDRPVLDYVMNDKDVLTELKVYGNFFDINSDKCLVDFKGRCSFSFDSEGLFIGELKEYSLHNDSIYLSHLHKFTETENEELSYYYNGNIKIHKKECDGETVIDQYFKENGTKCSALEYKLTTAKNHSCILLTNLCDSYNEDENIYMYVYANEEVSKGMIVTIASDGGRFESFRDYYEYEIKESEMILSHGGRIRAYVPVFRTYELKENPREYKITIDGLNMKGDYPNYDGTVTYTMIEGKEPSQDYRDFYQFHKKRIIETSFRSLAGILGGINY